MMRFTILVLISLSLLGVPELARAQSSETVARGARLWNATCNRCHNRRSPIERTDRQWDVIVRHMRTRAYLTKSEVQAIAAFLKTANADQKRDGRRPQSPPDSTTGLTEERIGGG